EYAGDLDSDVINVEDIDEVRDGISGVVWKIFHYEKIDINEFKCLVEAALAGTDNYEFLK
ncbi:hypothetical protein VQ643_14860, partial [Pseudomonas sp. F1_0610]|uniref:hypothetical protein n=1 Tax=Pseudomonas sp. F1_0610 TaxID=3114284 RepID=UPI0039C4D18D